MKTNASLPVLFQFNNKEVRIFEKDGQPWFVAREVCDILELDNITNALRGLDDDEKITFTNSKGNPRAGIPHTLILINEAGLYSLTIRSNKPEAKMFRRWVFHEILPSIRKTGGYQVPSQQGAALKRAEAMLNNSRVRVAKLAKEIVKGAWDFLSPEARQCFTSHLLETATGKAGLIPLPHIEKSYSATEIGQTLGVSANAIGRVATAHNLKTSEYGHTVLDKARGHDKQVPSFRYNEAGKKAIERLIAMIDKATGGTA